MPHYTDLEDKETFQIILLDPSYYPTPTGDGELLMQYNVVKEPGSCTVGIENNNEDIGISYLYNEYYDATANELVNGIAIKFTTKSPTIVSVDDDEEINHLIPTAYSLDQNFPNPFNPETRISYSIPEQSNVKISIYDINGTLINILHEGNQSAGRYEVVWNGESSSGYKVGSGVYFYRMQANSFVRQRK